jgi:TctA family transporter
LEENLRVALIASKGDVAIFFTSPISLTFLCLSVLSIVWSLRSSRNSIDPPSKESNP